MIAAAGEGQPLIGSHIAFSVEGHVSNQAILLRLAAPAAFAISLEAGNVRVPLCLDECLRLILRQSAEGC